jgi:hypothetical protein
MNGANPTGCPVFPLQTITQNRYLRKADSSTFGMAHHYLNLYREVGHA